MKRKDTAEALHHTRPVMTVREVSVYLRVHPITIYRLLKKNQIPAYHLGSDWRFNIEDLDRWRKQQQSLIAHRNSRQ